MRTMSVISESIIMRRKVADLIMRYNWLTPEDGKRMLGWLACALVGDSLKHRPHVWLSGYPGKSWFMEHIQDALHQNRYNFHSSPVRYTSREGTLFAQVVDAADYRDTKGKTIQAERRRVQKVIQACRAASGWFHACGNYGPLCFSACLMSWEQPEMTRYETRQFAPVRLGTRFSYEDFLRYGVEADGLLSDSCGVALELQNLILESTDEIAEAATRLEQEAEHDGSDNPHQVEINAIRGALSAGWQWWSGSDELIGYWKGERSIRGHPE